MYLKEKGFRWYQIDSSGSKEGQMVGSCEYGNET